LLLLIDNFDSFTYNLLDYFAQLGASCKVIRNNACSLSDIESWQPSGLVISPGPETPAQAGITLSAIAHFYSCLPILGICLGHQALGQFFGAKLLPAAEPVHGFTAPLIHNGHAMFAGVPQHNKVMRYHSLILEGLEKTPLQVTATTPQGEVMALAHTTLPIYGVQFHPESVLTENGLHILSNCLNLMHKGNQN